MTLRAVRAALSTRERCRIDGVAQSADLRRLLTEAGLGLYLGARLGGRTWGALYRRVIAVRRHLDPGTVRAVVAHEYAHHALGHDRLVAGPIYYDRPTSAGEVPTSVLEVQAQVYAFALLLGPPAPTLDGLTEQIRAGDADGLPLDLLFTGASILTRRHDDLTGYPLLG